MTLFTPRYRGVEVPDSAERWTRSASISPARSFDGQLIEVPLGPGARMMLVDCPALYDRAGIYNEHNVDYPDNPVRFAFLSLAALEWAAHAAGAAVGAARARLAGGPRCRSTRGRARWTRAPLPRLHASTTSRIRASVDKSWVPRLGLRWDDFTLDGLRVLGSPELPQGGR